MRLREALDRCTDLHSDDWVRMTSGGRGRPATGMLASLFDPGRGEAGTRALTGHTIAVYEPDARLSLIWPVPDDDDHAGPGRHERTLPEWAEQDSPEWNLAKPGWVVVLLGGSPIWQELLLYLDWGSGVGGYVPDFQPVYGGSPGQGRPSLERWETTVWAVGLAGLVNRFSSASDWHSFDPTRRIAPEPSAVHPVDAVRRS